jgi:dTDP-4-dehydrorhamnose reductase
MIRASSICTPSIGASQPRPILILGSTGQLGRAWLSLRHLLPRSASIIAPSRRELDLTHGAAIEAFIERLSPGVILNGAAYNAVDQAELEPEWANAINHLAPAAMARAARRVDAALVHISTNYVFDRFQGPSLRETDAVSPRGVYARSKYAGEQAVQSGCDRHMIIRTAWLYSDQGGFVQRMLELGRDRAELRIVQDQWGTPTAAIDLALASLQLADRLAADPSLAGLYHYSHGGETTWYDFAVAIFEQARLAGLPLSLQRLIPVETADYPTPAPRPAYAVLNLDRTRSVLGQSEGKPEGKSTDWPPQWDDRLAQLFPGFLSDISRSTPIPTVCR